MFCRLTTIKAQHNLESHSYNHYCSSGHDSQTEYNQPDASTAANSVAEEGLPSEYSIVTTECVAYSTSQLEESNDVRSSEIYESVT